VGAVLLAGCTFVAITPETTVEDKMKDTKTNGEDTVILELVRTIEPPFTPHAIALDSASNLFVVELNQPHIYKFEPSGSLVTTWGSGGRGEGQFAFSGPELTGGFVAVDEEDNVYVSDTYNNRVQKFDGNGVFLTVWATEAGEGVPLKLPGPISADLDGHMFVADLSGIHQFDLAGSYSRTLAAAGELRSDHKGNLYAPRAFDNTLVKFNAEGLLVETWGGTGPADGQFNFPLFLVIDEHNQIYVAGRSGRIQIFSNEGTFIGWWNNPGNGDGPVTSTIALAFDKVGQLYAASLDRSTIYVLRPR
jgi:DNA-binding beta-propeller fold protein YncE